jgi:hypothetical protein
MTSAFGKNHRLQFFEILIEQSYGSPHVSETERRHHGRRHRLGDLAARRQHAAGVAGLRAAGLQCYPGRGRWQVDMEPAASERNRLPRTAAVPALRGDRDGGGGQHLPGKGDHPGSGRLPRAKDRRGRGGHPGVRGTSAAGRTLRAAVVSLCAANCSRSEDRGGRPI